MGLRLLAQDNFTRANENPLSDGGRWGGIVSIPAIPELTANTCQPSALSTDCTAYWKAIPWPNDQWIQIKIGTFVNAATHAILALLRLDKSGATFTGYEAVAVNGSNYLIRKFLAGVGTTILTAVVAPTSGDVVLFEAQGTTLTLTVNGTVIGTVVDAGIPSGVVALDLFSSDALANSTLTDFQAGDFAAAGAGQGWVNSHRSFVNLR